MEIDDLKNIWKENTSRNTAPDSGSGSSLIETLKKAERKVLARYLLMSFFMAFAFYILGGKVLSLKQYDNLTYTGMYLLFAAMIAVFTIVWSTFIIFRKNDISNPSIEFLKSIKKKFERRKMIRRIIIPVYLAAITLGITLVYIEVLSPLETFMRVLIHIFVVVFILAVSYLASKREKRRYERTYKLIEGRIDELLKDYDS